MNPIDNVDSVVNSMRRHEDNIKFLNSQSNGLAKSIAELYGMVEIYSFVLGKTIWLSIF